MLCAPDSVWVTPRLAFATDQSLPATCETEQTAEVLVAVAVAVLVGVLVPVLVGVFVPVFVAVLVPVFVGVLVPVLVGVKVGVQAPPVSLRQGSTPVFGSAVPLVLVTSPTRLPCQYKQTVGI